MVRDALPSETTVSAWARLLRAQRVSLGIVERRLKAASLPPLEWYDVLLELERADGLRPRDLQARLLLAQSNLSRLLDRLQAAGLIERSSCEDDARGLVVRITGAGRALRRRIWPVYAAAIQEAVGGKLTAADAAKLAGLLEPLTDAG